MRTPDRKFLRHESWADEIGGVEVRGTVTLSISSNRCHRKQKIDQNNTLLSTSSLCKWESLNEPF